MDHRNGCACVGSWPSHTHCVEFRCGPQQGEGAALTLLRPLGQWSTPLSNTPPSMSSKHFSTPALSSHRKCKQLCVDYQPFNQLLCFNKLAKQSGHIMATLFMAGNADGSCSVQSAAALLLKRENIVFIHIMAMDIPSVLCFIGYPF